MWALLESVSNLVRIVHKLRAVVRSQSCKRSAYLDFFLLLHLINSIILRFVSTRIFNYVEVLYDIYDKLGKMGGRN